MESSLVCRVKCSPIPYHNPKKQSDWSWHQHLAITPDGEFYEHPNYSKSPNGNRTSNNEQFRIRRKGSTRRHKFIRELAWLHEHIANQRKDRSHKIYRNLVNEYRFIAFENLIVLGMVKNHHLAKSIVDASWIQLVKYTMYKRKKLVVVSYSSVQKHESILLELRENCFQETVWACALMRRLWLCSEPEHKRYAKLLKRALA